VLCERRALLVALARWTGEFSHVFLAQSAGFVAAGLIN
jgi:hypothetical protein